MYVVVANQLQNILFRLYELFFIWSIYCSCQSAECGTSHEKLYFKKINNEQ